MNIKQTAAAMHRVADALEQAGTGRLIDFPNTMLTGEAAVGAAAMLCYLRDCITSSPHDTWSRENLLVLLEITSRDGEIFPSGIGVQVWNYEDDDEQS